MTAEFFQVDFDRLQRTETGILGDRLSNLSNRQKSTK